MIELKKNGRTREERITGEQEQSEEVSGDGLKSYGT